MYHAYHTHSVAEENTTACLVHLDVTDLSTRLLYLVSQQCACVLLQPSTVCETLTGVFTVRHPWTSRYALASSCQTQTKPAKRLFFVSFTRRNARVPESCLGPGAVEIPRHTRPVPHLSPPSSYPPSFFSRTTLSSSP